MCERSEIQIYIAFELDSFKTVVMDSIVYIYSSIILCVCVFCPCISISYTLHCKFVTFRERENMLVFCITTTWKPIEANTQISNFNKPIKLIKFRSLAARRKWTQTHHTKMMKTKRLTIHSSWIITKWIWNRSRKESANEQEKYWFTQ